MKVLINEDIPVALWEGFIERNRHSTPFHTPSFFRFFNSVKGFRARAFAVSDNGELKSLAVLTLQKEKGPLGFFSRRAIIYGGPLAVQEYPEALNLLLGEISDYIRKKVIYTEVRNLSDYSSFKDIYLANGYKYIPYLNVRVDTRDMDLIKKRMSSSRLRQIKKAQQQSVVCFEAENADEVKVFYGMLKQLYKNKLHKPLPPEDFFLKFYEAQLGMYLLVRHDNKIIGGIMCPILNGKAAYEFYICGLDDDYKELFPSVIATWSAIEYAGKNNLPLFDFMGAGKPEEHYGVRDFKVRFGGEIVEYGRFIKISNAFLYHLGETGLGLVKYLS
jgi:serine/alanine adding enzyme